MRKAPIYFVHKRLICFSNSTHKGEMIEQIIKNPIKKHLRAFPAYWRYGKYLLTDGNNRVRALIKRGDDYIPIAELNKEEYELIKCSENTKNILIYYPNPSRVIKRPRDRGKYGLDY